MKKIYLAALTLAMTACVSNDDLNPVDNYGYIDVNVSNDPVMVTRAEGEPTWIISATSDKNTYENLKSSNNIVAAGTYTVNVKSHENETTANIKNIYGEPYYEGETNNVVVNAGATEKAIVDCSKAKNSKLTLVNNIGTVVGDKQMFTDVKLNAISGNRSLSLNQTNPSAFYSTNTDVSYNITYKYNNGEEQTLNDNGEDFTITIAEKATNYQIILSSNNNGKISVTINYDNTFANVESNTITFDAATGEKVTTPSQGE